MPSKQQEKVDSSCVVVAICGTAALERCLDRLARLDPAPGEIVISAAVFFELPENAGTARIVRSASDSPVDLAAAGLRAARGDVICLTEDHCLPVIGWVAALSNAIANNDAAVAGGAIDMASGARGFDWAFFMVDFYRYLPPVNAGLVSSLSVCNSAYRRRVLDELRDEWNDGFHETRMHGLLARRGPLIVTPDATVMSKRRVAVSDGIRERFVFGRLFAAKRFRRADTGRRLVYAALTPLLPVLLYARIARRCLKDGRLAGRMFAATLPLTALLVAWSAGELVGYLTARPPLSSPAAPDRPADGGQAAAIA